MAERLMNKLENFETRLHQYAEDRERYKDGSITYGMSYEFTSPQLLSIHLSENFNFSAQGIREAFKELATALNTDEKFSEVKIISGSSWLVTERPKFFQAAGFTIDNNSEEAKNSIKKYQKTVNSKRHKTVPKEKRKVEPSYCYITKEKLIELYGEKK